MIQVTSPDMGDGKTTLAANLAVAIAQSGKTVVVIDTDFRRPCVHKLFHLTAKQGLASVIGGDAELNDVIQPTSIPGLSVLPCGPIPANPAELLSMPGFQEALAVIREKYDYVIIDTPPLLAVTDPCVVVPHVDAVILTIRISKNVRPRALRAKEILATLRAKVLGVVVNGMDDFAGGYGYGYGYEHYQYTYAYHAEDRGTDSNDAGDSAGNGAEGTQTTEEAQPRRTRRPHTGKKKGFLGWLLNR